jgi:hypothetical protein
MGRSVFLVICQDDVRTYNYCQPPTFSCQAAAIYRRLHTASEAPSCFAWSKWSSLALLEKLIRDPRSPIFQALSRSPAFFGWI